jgi:hypothetical protein
MQKTIEQQIARAKQLLKEAHHASMATVNQDGSPHNTPFMFMYDETMEHVYWGSHPESEHSKNILRTGQIFVVLYDAIERGGLYMKAIDAHQLDGAELDKALAIHNKLRETRGQDPLPLGYYVGNSPQRMWSALIIQLWVNGTRRGEDGHIIQDIRTEINTTDLVG